MFARLRNTNANEQQLEMLLTHKRSIRARAEEDRRELEQLSESAGPDAVRRIAFLERRLSKLTDEFRELEKKIDALRGEEPVSSQPIVRRTWIA